MRHHSPLYKGELMLKKIAIAVAALVGLAGLSSLIYSRVTSES